MKVEIYFREENHEECEVSNLMGLVEYIFRKKNVSPAVELAVLLNMSMNRILEAEDSSSLFELIADRAFDAIDEKESMQERM